MNQATESSTKLISETEVLTTRVLNVPRERVFEAWTDSKQVAQWWGPRGFKNTFQEHDVRPGGHWRFVMHGPDGTDYKNHSVFVDVVKPERLAFDHVNGPIYHAEVSFEDRGGKTLLTWKMRFENARFLRDNHALVLSGNNDNLDRLEALLGCAA